jgi:Ca-activated chloride channel family protein
MDNDPAGTTQRFSNKTDRDWGLRTGRVSDDSGDSPLTVSHRFGLPTISANGAAAMVYMLLTVRVSQQANAGQYVPLNLCLVLDQSLSMRGEKMERVKDAARYVINKLGPQDTLPVVSFNDRANLVVAAQPVRNHGELQDQVDNIVPRGATELATGIRMGMDQLRLRPQQRNAVSAMLLLTDGDTYGDAPRCMELAEQARRQQIQITPLGVGEEWNEDLLEALAYRSGTHSEYINQPSAIVTAFQTHVEALQATYARNAQLIIQTPDGVRLAQLHRTRPLIGRVEVLPAVGTDGQAFGLGSLHAGEEQEFLLEFVVQPAAPGPVPLARVQLLYDQTTSAAPVRFPYEVTIPAEVPAGPVPPLDTTVKTAVEKVVAYKLQQKAWQELTEGNLVSATHKLRMVATRLIEAGEDELAQTVQAEVAHLERTGHASAAGTKQIKYGTRGLGRTQAMRPAPGTSG